MQINTIDARLAQLRIPYQLAMLTADKDFRRVAAHSSLRAWGDA